MNPNDYVPAGLSLADLYVIRDYVESMIEDAEAAL